MGKKLKRKSKCNQNLKVSLSTEYCILENSMRNCKLKPGKLVLIAERLSLPPYRNDDEFGDEDTELQLNIRPRTYCINGLCYSCSKPCGDPDIPCESCHMITYCSSNHRHKEINRHADLCVILTDIQNRGVLNSAKGLDAPGYRRLRVELIRMAEKTLGRDLEPREREILLFARVCHLCHATQDLERCFDCRSVYFCPGEHVNGHEQHCVQFRILRRILEMESASGFVAPTLPIFSVREMPIDFDRLVREIFEDNYERIDCTSYAALSQTASPILTTLYGIRNSTRSAIYMNRKLMKIHVIGAELHFECANLALWEKLFLHFLPNVGDLKLELFGPELEVPPDMKIVLQQPKLCVHCCSNARKLDVIFHCGKLYHQVKSDEPDLICLFNPGLYRKTGYANKDTWPMTIEKFCDYGVPVIVTSYTEIELPRDILRIREFREITIDEKPHRNPFASLRPERNFVSDDVTPLIYKNYFVAVIRGIASRR